jgi:hypothetical protein
MLMTYAAAAQRLANPRPCGGSLRGQCPMCGHPSALSLREFRDGNAALRCHACEAPISEIVRALRNGEAGAAPAPKLCIVTPEQKRERCRAIWRASLPLHGTPAEKYLRESRGIAIAIGPGIRFNPRAWHPKLKRNLPAMVSAVTDLAGRGVALHFTWLHCDGDRVVQIEEDSKTMYGQVAGHAVRFAGAVTERILLAEGIETALRSKQRMVAGGYDWSTWACLSASGIKNCAIPPGTSEIFIATDHDANGVGERAATQKVDELRARGIEANWKMPAAVEKDFADQ